MSHRHATPGCMPTHPSAGFYPRGTWCGRILHERMENPKAKPCTECVAAKRVSWYLTLRSMDRALRLL